MKVSYVDQASELLEKANADLEPELLTAATGQVLGDSGELNAALGGPSWWCW